MAACRPRLRSGTPRAPQPQPQPQPQPLRVAHPEVDHALASGTGHVILGPHADGDHADAASAAAAAAGRTLSSPSGAPPRSPSRAASPTAGFTGADAIAAAEQQPAQSLAAAVAAASAAAAAAGAAAAVAAASSLAPRVASGVLLGAAAAAVIVDGRALFLAAALAIVYQASREFFGLVTSRGVTRGDDPPPPAVAAATTLLCLGTAAATYAAPGLSGGAVLGVAAFALLALNVVAVRRPSFGGLSSTLFGLFYCGYLPSFWIKLRGLSMLAPPFALLPGCPQPSVGLVATFVAAACIVAADTGAFFVGRSLGRTKLTEISPKKTVEGAAGGLASAVAAALGLHAAAGWPASGAAAAGYGLVTFLASIFGDLVESVIKRDAGMKDSGNLIPGHGGLLDRFDSYIFTAAVAYSYVTMLLPKFGLA